MDQTIKIWDLKQQGYEDDPITIYDHDEEIVCADIRPADAMMASMDLQGTVYIRSMEDPENALYTITDIPKGPDDYARLLLNLERPQDESVVIILLNDQIIIFDIQGRQIEQASINDSHTLLKADNASVCDNKFVYKLICQSFREFITQR